MAGTYTEHTLSCQQLFCNSRGTEPKNVDLPTVLRSANGPAILNADRTHLLGINHFRRP